MVLALLYALLCHEYGSLELLKLAKDVWIRVAGLDESIEEELQVLSHYFEIRELERGPFEGVFLFTRQSDGSKYLVIYLVIPFEMRCFKSLVEEVKGHISKYKRYLVEMEGKVFKKVYVVILGVPPESLGVSLDGVTYLKHLGELLYELGIP